MKANHKTVVLNKPITIHQNLLFVKNVSTQKLLQKLLEVSNQTAMLTTFNEVDMTTLWIYVNVKDNLSKTMMVLN